MKPKNHKHSKNNFIRTSKNLFLLVLTAFILSSCNKDDNDCQGADCLPPATQTGAGTFGCLINGEPYIDNSGLFNCFYQFVDGEYYFSITANFNKTIKGIGLGSQEIELNQGTNYQLIEIGSENFSADIYIDTNNNFETSSTNAGNILITNFDIQNKIISATFEFTVINPTTGFAYEIKQGRFDTKFTQ